MPRPRALALTRRRCPPAHLAQPADLERGARTLLDQLDDLSVDVPKEPLQVGWTCGLELRAEAGWAGGPAGGRPRPQGA